MSFEVNKKPIISVVLFKKSGCVPTFGNKGLSKGLSKAPFKK